MLADPSSSPVSRLEGLRLLRNSIVKNKNQLVELMNRTEGNSVDTLLFQVHLEAAGVNLSVVAVFRGWSMLLTRGVRLQLTFFEGG